MIMLPEIKADITINKVWCIFGAAFNIFGKQSHSETKLNAVFIVAYLADETH